MDKVLRGELITCFFTGFSHFVLPLFRIFLKVLLLEHLVSLLFAVTVFRFDFQTMTTSNNVSN